MSRRCVIIGGGLAGLAGAIRLAKAGFHTELYEKNATLGGKMNELTLGAYRFDTGPSLLTMPFVIENLFKEIGVRLSDLLEIRSVDPLCRYFFADGAVFDASADERTMQVNLKNFAPDDVNAFEKFMTYCRRIYDLTADAFIFDSIHELTRVLRLKNLRTLLHIRQLDAFRTVHQAVSRYFSNSNLVQVFDRYPTYNGSNPFNAPATLNIIPYVEYGLGGYYIKGGMYRLIEAMTAAAKNVGVRIHTDTPVSKIEYSNGRVSGIRIHQEFIPAHCILCNADVVVAYNQLIENQRRYRNKLNALEPSISGLVFLWGVEGRYSRLSQHNILFSENYRFEFDQIFDKLEPPTDPTIYLSVTSKSDPEHAPADGENWFILVNMPYLTEGQDWKTIVSTMRRLIIKRLEKLGIFVAEKIRVEKILTPQDFLHRFAGNRGSIYGISSNSRNSAFLRPPNRDRRIKGLYFAGGSTHPGGGVPLAVQSGKIAAELIIENENN